jgi:L-ascorbate metabolism protein UlaG (beta-lactamase superfamily)
MNSVGIVTVCGILVAQSSLLVAVENKPGSGIRVTYLGNAGYQIEDGKVVILVDPYISQFRRGGMGPTDFTDTTDPILTPDGAGIDKRITRADYIFITHSHCDHLLDAPYIAKKTHAVTLRSAAVVGFSQVTLSFTWE